MDLMGLSDLHQLNKLNSVFSSFNTNVSEHEPKERHNSENVFRTMKVKDK